MWERASRHVPTVIAGIAFSILLVYPEKSTIFNLNHHVLFLMWARAFEARSHDHPWYLHSTFYWSILRNQQYSIFNIMFCF